MRENALTMNDWIVNLESIHDNIIRDGERILAELDKRKFSIIIGDLDDETPQNAFNLRSLNSHLCYHSVTENKL